MTRTLIVADPQRDFCEGGSLGVAGGAAVVSRIDRLLNSDHGYVYVVATRDHHIKPGAHFSDEPDFVDSWPPHCVVGTPGAEFHDQLATRTSQPSSIRVSTSRPIGVRGAAVDETLWRHWLRIPRESIKSISGCHGTTACAAMHWTRCRLRDDHLLDLTAVAPHR